MRVIIVCLLLVLNVNAARWPQVAIPFFYRQGSGFLVALDETSSFCEYSSGRKTIMSLPVCAISCEKKSGTLNGKKIINHDIILHGKQLCVNGMYSCIALHCIFGRYGVQGYMFVSGADLKKNMRHVQSQSLFSMNSAIRSWHIHQSKVVDDLYNTLERVAQTPSMVVRVLLSQAEHHSSIEWNFSCEKGFWIYCADDSGQLLSKRRFCPRLVKVSCSKGQLLCNGKKIAHSIRIQPLSGHGDCNGIMYDGDFFITSYKNSFLCINHVELEDYICAVLRTESWPGWPLEVNKVFAIACRSYVASQAFDARRIGRPFHVKNTNVHQTYQGKHAIAVLKEAVAQTRGIVLGYNQKPILAMFDCCCGGVVPAHIADFDFKKAPYLARAYPCTYCKKCSLYSWMTSYEYKEFFDACSEHKKQLKTVHDVIITKKDKAGLVAEVKLKGKNTHVVLPGKTLYSMFKDIKSFHFDVTKKSGKFIFSGRGFGHHLGLCQWGAREMVRDGWDYKSILQFYYPQTQFMKLS